MAWTVIYRDTEKTIERDGDLERLTYTNPNRQQLQTDAVAAFLQNRANITRNKASIAVANPTNAQVVNALKDALGQLSQLEAQNNALMRLVLGMLDGTD
jgi:hypothetical protein